MVEQPDCTFQRTNYNTWRYHGRIKTAL